MFRSALDIINKSLRRSATNSREVHTRTHADTMQKIDTELTANMRALRLTATIADHLLSRGMAASDVVYLALGITSTYCLRKVHIDISHTILTLSQERGIDREPLTLVRTVSARAYDYYTIQLLEGLAKNIKEGGVPLAAAEARLDKILALPKPYKPWLINLAAGGVSAGVVMLYSSNPLAWLTALLMGVMVNATLHRAAKFGMPSFYAQAVAALLVTLIAMLVALAASSGFAPFLDSVSPTLIVIGGIVLLLAGMMIVAAFQDALDEYYLTAAARLLKVMMMTGGIVLGVTVGLYIASRFGVSLTATPDRLGFSPLNYQYLGAAVLAASFAIVNYTKPIGVIGAGLVGFMSLYMVLFLVSVGISIVPASGIAAALVGLSATFLLHFFRIPTIATISAGIVPLVPGLSLYSGLTFITQAVPNSLEFNNGMALLLRAVLIAAAIAAGATLGNLIGRPARRRLIRMQNRLPRPRFSLTLPADATELFQRKHK